MDFKCSGSNSCFNRFWKETQSYIEKEMLGQTWHRRAGKEKYGQAFWTKKTNKYRSEGDLTSQNFLEKNTVKSKTRAKFDTTKSGNSSVGRALASQAEGREFESRFPLWFFGVIRRSERSSLAAPFCLPVFLSMFSSYLGQLCSCPCPRQNAAQGATGLLLAPKDRPSPAG